jgi:hypothetical protein
MKKETHNNALGLNRTRTFGERERTARTIQSIHRAAWRRSIRMGPGEKLGAAHFAASCDD